MKKINKKIVKKQIAYLLSIALLAGACGGNEGKSEEKEAESETADKTELTIKGSDTVLPLAQQEAEVFMKDNKTSTITVVGGGTGVGVSALLEGTTHIAMASRELKTEEKLKFQGAKKDIKEVIVAYDALSIIVNPKNKVEKLTREQIESIFTGKVTNWKEVGGADEKIITYSRETSSGTYEFFKEHVMDKKNYAASTLMMPATGAIVQSVSQTAGAIGYVGLAYATPEVKALNVSYDSGKTFVKPTVEAAKDKSYPIARPLFFLYNTSDAELVKPFVDYVLSDSGQALVKETGYVPVK